MLPRWIPALCRWHRFERARERYLRRPALPEALRTLLGAPLPSDSTPLFGLSLLSLDVETSGLDPERDQLLSIGSVVLAQGQIRLDEASHLFVQSDKLDRRSAVIHHILPEMLQNGVSLDDAMMQLFSQLTGRVALAHGSTVERRFIDHYLADRFGLPPCPNSGSTPCISKSVTPDCRALSNPTCAWPQCATPKGCPPIRPTLP